MLRIVVAVGYPDDPIYFEREKIGAYYDSGVSNCLIINDLSSGKPVKIGAFSRWDYWHYMED